MTEQLDLLAVPVELPKASKSRRSLPPLWTRAKLNDRVTATRFHDLPDGTRLDAYVDAAEHEWIVEIEAPGKFRHVSKALWSAPYTGSLLDGVDAAEACIRDNVPAAVTASVLASRSNAS